MADKFNMFEDFEQMSWKFRMYILRSQDLLNSDLFKYQRVNETNHNQVTFAIRQLNNQIMKLNNCFNNFEFKEDD